MSNRIAMTMAAASIAVLALAGCATTSTTSAGSGGTAPTSAASSPAASAADLSTETTSLGSIVVDGAGMTVYVFDKDTAGSPSTCSGPCAQLWPAVVTTAATPAVTGITGKVGTVATASGTQQLTLDGLPLYTYAKDTKAGDITGQGVGGIWWAVGADGTKVSATPDVKSGY